MFCSFCTNFVPGSNVYISENAVNNGREIINQV